MKGDKLIIQEEHIQAARGLIKLLLREITQSSDKFIMSIAGESGSGKSEIASALADYLFEKGVESVILQQDDYFVYPPKTNARMRRIDINHVGLSEVHLTLLDQNLEDIMEGKNEIEKPLVLFDEDCVVEETIELEGVKVVIVEGTYTTLLKNVHRHIFIDRTYVDTRETRKRRAREEQDEYLERTLEIEHKIVSSHKPQADIVVTRDYEVKAKENEGKEE